MLLFASKINNWIFDVSNTILPNKPTKGRKLFFTPGMAYYWEENDATYPATDYILKYKLLNSTGKIEIASTASGIIHVFDISSTVTKDWAAGDYVAIKYFENISTEEKFQTEKIDARVEVDVLASDTADLRSHNKKMLDALEALEQGRADKSISQFSIAGRSIVYLTPDEIIKWRAYYARLVAAEENGNKVPAQRNIYAQFTEP